LSDLSESMCGLIYWFNTYSHPNAVMVCGTSLLSAGKYMSRQPHERREIKHLEWIL